ncbi:MAG: glycosyltransferase family 2 protein [Deltaproteobacteria bacterium]|nr:glycosyltransferase family 2 protein [Deltaproteobacteria bacterium]
MRHYASKQLVSVIIPTYNRSKTILRAINSVLNQTYQAFELFIIDDGSNDKTAEIVTSLKDHRLKYIRLSKNSGASTARNVGIDLAEGNYIAFLDSDDEWFPTKLSKQLSNFDRCDPTIGVMYTAFYYPRTYTKGLRYFVAELSGDISSSILYENPAIHPTSVMIKRECFQSATRFDQTLPACEDWDLWIQLSQKCYFGRIKEPLYLIHKDTNRISTSYLRCALGYRLLLQKHYNLISQNTKYLAHHHFLIGRSLLYGGRFREARKEFVKSMTLWPRHFPPFLYLAFSFFGRNYLGVVNRLGSH